MFEAGIPLWWVERQTLGAAAEGISRDKLYADCLIERHHGDDRDRVTSAQLTLLYMNICTSIDDEAHGLGGSRIRLGHAELAMRAILGCPTLDRAISAMSRFYSLASSPVRFALHLEADDAVLAVHCENRRNDESPRFLEDCYLSFTFMLLSQFLGYALPLRSVDTRDFEHVNLNARHWATRSPVRLAAASALRMPLPTLSLLRGAASADHDYRHLMRSWVAFVERDMIPAVFGETGRAGLSVSNLAREAGVSPSTLRRRMQRDHGGFREARRQAMIHSGLALLRNDHHSVDAVAVQLGYSDARSFRRFIKNATGRTPEEIRAGLEIASWAAPNQLVHQRIDELAERMSR